MSPTFEYKIVQFFSQLVKPFLGYSQGLKYNGSLFGWDSLNVTVTPTQIDHILHPYM